MSRSNQPHAYSEAFSARHTGPNAAEREQMLAALDAASLDQLIERIVPPAILRHDTMALPAAKSEQETLKELKRIASRNKVYKSFIGMGYYGTHTPTVILRNILENPAWYTAYTPYQPEISQGRLEALLNFQTMVAEMTGMDIANASLLDEATAAAEAMALCQRNSKLKTASFFVSRHCHPQTIAVVKTRAGGFGIKVIVGDDADALKHEVFGVLLQYPASTGEVFDYRDLIAAARAKQVFVAMACDLLALTLLESPGELGADIAIGTTQRFGVPFGYGGPHAAYMSCRDALKRTMPGRLVGVSVDAHGNRAYRLALQTREQHIRREKATSNICTAQVLLAVMASMYAVYHGPHGLKAIANRTHALTVMLAEGLKRMGWKIPATAFFDTITVKTGVHTETIHARAIDHHANLRRIDETTIGISLDETTTTADLKLLFNIFAENELPTPTIESLTPDTALPDNLARKSIFLAHPVFHEHQSETQMLRYLRRLADKDLALDRTMIPLGSCTMKLNATTEMIPVTWPEFANMHPYAPSDQALGYLELIRTLEKWLCEITGYDAVSLQPNSGAQGEYAGLLAIHSYHASRGEGHRDVVLIPSSAHGTNPASAQMAGYEVVVTACDAQGNVDFADLKEKAEKYSSRLAALMVTYPSTHGVFEDAIVDICALIHEHGGQVYMDGANLNALVGVAAPGKFGADVSHLNLHKTFCIPHGGGGPGVGPVAVRAHLAPFLPGSPLATKNTVGPVSAAPNGSAGILPISWAYIAMMGADGLRDATQVAILNANYIAAKLSPHYPVLYSGHRGLVAHECILDLRPIKDACGISGEDVAKRLMDYGFHAPTMSFPVPGTLMIEPTESEAKDELDRFCDAMIAIREEIRLVESGVFDREDNPLKHAPHTARVVTADEWTHSYTRRQAAYPLASLEENKYWPPVGRVDNVFGDRNLVCSCPPLSVYQEDTATTSTATVAATA